MAIVTHEELTQDFALTKEDVWGDYEKGTKGMIVARYGDKCPIFGDTLKYKSSTFVFDKSQYDEVLYWISYVYGGDCISAEVVLTDGKMAVRADYQCW